MTPAEWKRLVLPLLPASERWAFRGKLCYRQPVEHVLVGVYGEGSAYGGTYVWRVSMPLFIPDDGLVLSWSERVGGGAHRIENADDEELSRAVSLAVVGAHDDVVTMRKLIASAEEGRNLRTSEAAAYAAVLLNELPTARRFLAEAHATSDGPAWVGDVIERMRAVDALLEAGNVDGTVELLVSWERRTVAALKVAVLP